MGQFTIGGTPINSTTQSEIVEALGLGAASSLQSTLDFFDDNVTLISVTRGDITPDAIDASNTRIRFHPDATTKPGRITSVSLRINGTGTGEIFYCTVDNATQNLRVLAKSAVLTIVNGVNTFSQNVTVPAGVLVGYKRLTGTHFLRAVATTGRGIDVAAGAVTAVGNTTPFVANNTDHAISFVTEELDETLEETLDEFRTRNRAPLMLSAGWNHVLGYGQSLAIGADATPIITSVASSYHRTFGVGVKMTNPTLGGLVASQDDGTTKALVEDTNSPFTGTTGETSLSAFTRAFSSRYARAKGAPPIWFASTAGRGGRAIREIDNFTTQYQNFIYHVTTAKTRATELGLAYACPIILFKHGEADQQSSTSKALYKLRLLRLIERAKLEIMAITGQSQPPQWLFTLPALQILTSAGATEAILEVCDEREDCWVSVPVYRIPHVNVTHPSAAGQVLMGHYEARVAAQLAAGQTPDRLRWLGASANGTAFTAVIEGPTPAAFNTSIIPAAADNGIRIIDNTGTLALSSLAVGTARQNPATGLWETPITCTLSRALGTNPRFRYARDVIGAGMTITNGASGNVFGTETETVVISGTTYSLAHAAPPADLPIYIEE